MELYKNRWNLRLFNKEYHCNEIKKREKIENSQSLLGVFLRRRFDWNSIVVYESNWKRHVNSSEKQTGRIWNGLRINKADSLKNDCHHQWSEWLLTDLVYEKIFYVELRIGSIMYGVLYSKALFNAILVSLHVCSSTSRSSYMNTTFGDVVFSSFLHWLVCLSSSIVENVSLSSVSLSFVRCMLCVMHSTLKYRADGVVNFCFHSASAHHNVEWYCRRQSYICVSLARVLIFICKLRHKEREWVRSFVLLSMYNSLSWIVFRRIFIFTNVHHIRFGFGRINKQWPIVKKSLFNF